MSLLKHLAFIELGKVYPPLSVVSTGIERVKGIEFGYLRLVLLSGDFPTSSRR